MRRHRFIIDSDLSQPSLTVSKPDLVHQWREVLKLKLDEEILLSDGKGENKTAKIVKMDKTKIEIEILATPHTKYQILNTLRPVTLYCAILKGDNFEWVVQKATEVGVVKVVPIITEHIVKTGLNRARLERIMKEASEQCGRAVVPEFGEPIKLGDALKIENEIKIFCDFTDTQFVPERDLTLPSPLQRRGRERFLLSSAEERTGREVSQSIAVFVGPEGGWSKAERAAAEKTDCLIRSLGPLTLRAETAAVVASYLATSL